MTTTCVSPCVNPCVRPCVSPCVSPCANPCVSPCVSPCVNTCYEEKQFVDFLKQLMTTESQIECLKIKLALRPDFNCEDAFRIFELDGRGFLTCEDLKYGLGLLGICATDCDVRLLMKRFDLQKCGSINYADFFDILVPFEKEYRNMVECRVPNSCCPCRCPDVFCPSTVCILKELFLLILNSENCINNARKCFGTLRLKLRDIFNHVSCGLCYFSNCNLSDYLKRNCAFNCTKDTDLLFIRLDKNRNGKVDYREVEDEVTPLY